MWTHWGYPTKLHRKGGFPGKSDDYQLSPLSAVEGLAGSRKEKRKGGREQVSSTQGEATESKIRKRGKRKAKGRSAAFGSLFRAEEGRRGSGGIWARKSDKEEKDVSRRDALGLTTGYAER